MTTQSSLVHAPAQLRAKKVPLTANASGSGYKSGKLWLLRGRLGACLSILALVLPALNALAGFSSMYVFGDSLSATSGGGLQYPPPAGTSAENYYDGRFSNGKVWVEYLAEQLGVSFDPTHNFSNFGDDSEEVYNNIVYGNYYPPADIATSLYVFWPGCSDCFALAIFQGTNSWTDGINNAMSNVTAVVDVLYSQGVRTLLLPNSVDISKVPFFTYTADSLGSDTNEVASLAASVHDQVPQYNAALAATVNQLRAKYPGLTIYAPDFYSQFDYLFSHPAEYGLTKTNIDALEDPALTDKSFDGPGENYLFWDYLHPTTKVHAAVANFVQQSISFVPLISRFTHQGSTNVFDVVNLPVGQTGALESTTNLLNPAGWKSLVSIVATNASQTVSISTNGLGNTCFFRLNFPP
jgi:phospholipase/lecithinase/hemolysin